MLVAKLPSTILALHAGALGDCVLALHFIAAMKKMWGGPRVTVAARSSIVRWAKHGAEELIKEPHGAPRLFMEPAQKVSWEA